MSGQTPQSVLSAMVVTVPVPIPFDERPIRLPDIGLGDTRTAAVNYRDILQASDSILGTPTFTVSPPGLTISNVGTSNTGYPFVFFQASAPADSEPTDFAIAIAVTTALGEVINRTVWLSCASLSMSDGTSPPTQVIAGPAGPYITSISADTTNFIFTWSDGRPNTLIPVEDATVTQAAIAAALGGLPIIGSTPVAANTLGGTSVDNPAVQQAAVTVTQLIQMQGDALSAALIANNPHMVPSTAGIFWDATDAAAAVAAGGAGTVNVNALFAAAAAWSGTNKRPVYFPSATYDFGTTKLTISQNDVHFIFAKGARIITTLNSAPGALFSITGNHVTIKGGKWGPPADTYTDWTTGLILPTPDFKDWKTVQSGLWAGLTVFCSWQTSATQLFVNKSDTLYFDNLPAGYTLATLQALANTAPIYVNNNKFVGKNAFIANGAAISAVTISSWSGYQVVLTPQASDNWAVLLPSAGNLPAQIRTPETSASSGIVESEAIPAPTVVLLSGPPVYSAGGIFNFKCNDFTMIDCEFINCSNGRQVLGQGNRFLAWNCHGYATDGRFGSAIIRITGGIAPRWIGGTVFSGDQALQFVPGFSLNHGQISPSADQTIRGGRYTDVVAASLSAQTVACGLSVSNNNQYVAWATIASATPAGNQAIFPGPMPSGLTLALLQQSSPAWGNSVGYTAGTLQVNGSNQYICTQSGVSDPNSNGPSGQNNNIVDGTCKWNYVGPGSTLYVSSIQHYLQFGTCVNGAQQNSDGTFTVFLAQTSGSGTAITRLMAASTPLFFIAGTPLGAMTCSILDSVIEGCYLYAPSSNGISMTNADSQGVIDVSILNCTVDCTIAEQSRSGVAIHVDGGAYGGLRARLEGIHVIGPPQGGLETSGNVLKLIARGNTFETPTLASPNLPNISLCGCQSGAFSDNIVWCSPAGVPTMQVGDTTNISRLLITNEEITNCISIRSNEFLGAVDGGVVISLRNGMNRKVRDNLVLQASSLGTGNAGWLEVTAAAAGGDQADGNDLSQIDGQTYSILPGAPGIKIGFAETWNPAPAGAGVTTPPAQIPAAITTAIAAMVRPAKQLVTFTSAASVVAASATAAIIIVEIDQINVTGQTTLNLPAGAFDGQIIMVVTNGNIPNMVFSSTGSPSNWPAQGAPLPVGGLQLEWSANLAGWISAGLTTAGLATMAAPTVAGQLGVSGNQVVVGN